MQYKIVIENFCKSQNTVLGLFYWPVINLQMYKNNNFNLSPN